MACYHGAPDVLRDGGSNKYMCMRIYMSVRANDPVWATERASDRESKRAMRWGTDGASGPATAYIMEQCSGQPLGGAEQRATAYIMEQCSGQPLGGATQRETAIGGASRASGQPLGGTTQRTTA